MTSLAGLGRPSLLAALTLAVAAGVLSAVGALRRSRNLAEAGTRAMVAAAAFVAVAAVALVNALLSNDFSIDYVASHTSRSLPRIYTLTALWSGMEGSLLFWTLLLTSFSAIALVTQRRRNPALVPWACAVLAGISAFFLALLLGPADPFVELATPPGDGRGLNPLLQSPGMVVHPPLLYTGFVGFSIPFAFAMAALASRHTDERWLTATRRWTLWSWSALSMGIVLGGAWAYTELGWGGYWAWDPVENASFMPWLTATAYLHSVVIQEKRRMLKVWNVSLILLTYVLALFGTFLTRSGLLSSIHTFSEGPVGKWFLPFLAAMLVGGLAVVAWRADRLRSDNRLDSLLSRESAFLFNNVLFVAAAFTVLWGTIYPIVAEVASGVRLSVGPPFYNSVFVPIGLALLGLAGIGPLISWRRMRLAALLRLVRTPLAAGATAAAATAAAGVRSPGALLAFGLCAFTVTAVAAEFVRGSRVHRHRDGLPWGPALGQTLLRNRRRYGGYVVHLGVVLIVIGLAGAAFRTERDGLLGEGESVSLAGYTLTYLDRTQADTAEKQVNEVEVGIYRGGGRIATLFPQRNFHVAQQQAQSEVAIRSTPVEDLYVVVTSIDPDGDVALRAFVNPLTWWIWAGAAVMLAGIAVLVSGASPRAVPARAPGAAREPAVAG